MKGYILTQKTDLPHLPGHIGSYIFPTEIKIKNVNNKGFILRWESFWSYAFLIALLPRIKKICFHVLWSLINTSLHVSSVSKWNERHDEIRFNRYLPLLIRIHSWLCHWFWTQARSRFHRRNMGKYTFMVYVVYYWVTTRLIVFLTSFHDSTRIPQVYQRQSYLWYIWKANEEKDAVQNW